jgi:LPXTG-site transpeptidase (sortase) family protein
MKSGLVYKSDEKIPEINFSRIVFILKAMALVLSKLGLGLMALAAVGLVVIYIPLISAEIHYDFNQSSTGKKLESVQQAVREEARVIQPERKIEKPTWEVPDTAYSIYIPKIFALSKVIPDVDAGNATEYMAALKQGVAEAKGLVHPGQKGTTYLFAHSVGSRVDFARYNAVFYLLDKLDIGDQVEVVYQGRLYKYEVVDREIKAPNDTSYLTPQNAEEKLVLQTCYPPGTTWQRLMVVAHRI